MDEERLIDIETKLAHQEDLLSALNEALTSQQAQIIDLERLCRSLVERVRSLADGGSEDPGDERPPHY